MPAMSLKQTLLWASGIAALIAFLAIYASAEEPAGVAPPPELPAPKAPAPTPAFNPGHADADFPFGDTRPSDPRPIVEPRLAVAPAAKSAPERSAIASPQAPTFAAQAPPVAVYDAEVATAEVRSVGPIRRGIGNIGERLARVGYDRVLVPRATTPPPPPAPRQYVQVLRYSVAPTPAPEPRALASPQAPAKRR